MERVRVSWLRLATFHSVFSPVPTPTGDDGLWDEAVPLGATGDTVL
jgi:hypothetical protein